MSSGDSVTLPGPESTPSNNPVVKMVLTDRRKALARRVGTTAGSTLYLLVLAKSLALNASCGTSEVIGT